MEIFVDPVRHKLPSLYSEIIPLVKLQTCISAQIALNKIGKERLAKIVSISLQNVSVDEVVHFKKRC